MTLSENTPRPGRIPSRGLLTVQLYPGAEFALRLRAYLSGQALLRRFAMPGDEEGPSRQEANQVFDKLVDAEEYNVSLLAKTAAPDLAGLEAKLAILVDRLKQWAGSVAPSPFEATTIELAGSALQDAGTMRESSIDDHSTKHLS